jgi:HD-like signal output (HDOD) protein
LNLGSVVLPTLDSHGAHAFLADCLAAPRTIAPLPQIAAQLAELTANPDTEEPQFASLIQSDPVLTGEVMRVANSPALRPRSPLVSLQQAIAWLGIGEVRNLAIAVMLRGEVFAAPGHDPECEELWREAWLAGLWAKEIACLRRTHVESAYLSALMHRTGAALALKLLSRYEYEQRTVMDAHTFNDLVREFEPACGRMLMSAWRLPDAVQEAASTWRDYRTSAHADLAGTVHAAHLLAQHTLHPQLLGEETVLESAVFEELGVVPEDRRIVLLKREQVRAIASI